jgi:hypothetical protein
MMLLGDLTQAIQAYNKLAILDRAVEKARLY